MNTVTIVAGPSDKNNAALIEQLLPYGWMGTDERYPITKAELDRVATATYLKGCGIIFRNIPPFEIMHFLGFRQIRNILEFSPVFIACKTETDIAGLIPRHPAYTITVIKLTKSWKKPSRQTR